MTSYKQKKKSAVTVGILFPGHSGEEDYRRMEKKLGPNVRLPIAHTALDYEKRTLDIMRTAGNEEALIKGALELADEDLDSIMWASASGSFAYGWEGAETQAYGLYEIAAVPASSTSFAFVNAIKCLSIERVAVAATYPHELSGKFTEFLQHAGIEVLGSIDGGLTTVTEASKADKHKVFELAKKTNEKYPLAEAILISDTALQTVEWLEELERAVKKPVLTANQVTVWYGLQLAGAKQKRDKLGSLFHSSN